MKDDMKAHLRNSMLGLAIATLGLLSDPSGSAATNPGAPAITKFLGYKQDHPTVATGSTIDLPAQLYYRPVGSSSYQPLHKAGIWISLETNNNTGHPFMRAQTDGNGHVVFHSTVSKQMSPFSTVQWEIVFDPRVDSQGQTVSLAKDYTECSCRGFFYKTGK